MIPFLFFLALFLGFCMGAAPARACTTVLVGRDASETGEVLVGHNEDSGGRYVMRSHIVSRAFLMCLINIKQALSWLIGEKSVIP